MDLSNTLGKKKPKFLIVNTACRTNGTRTNFNINVSNSMLSNLASVTLYDIKLPYCWDTINESNNKFTLRVFSQIDSSHSDFEFNIINGGYSIITFIGMLTTMFKNVNNDFNVVYDSITGKLEFYHPTRKFVLIFMQGNSSYSLLGFDPFHTQDGTVRNPPVYTFESTQTEPVLISEQLVDLSPDDFIFLKSNIVTKKNQQFYMIGAADDNLFGVIPILCNYGDIISASAVHLYSIDVNSNIKSYTQLHFELTKIDGTPLTNMKKDWTVTLMLNPI